MECSLLYKHCCNRSTSLVKLSLDDDTSCLSVRICLELKHICCEKYHLKEIVDTFLSMCRYRAEYCRTAPVLWDELILCKLLLNSLYIGAFLINLVDRYYDLDSGSLCMVYSLDSLWHNTIIGSYNKYCYICTLCTTHTHCCERLMSRSIKECDGLAIYIYN